MNLDRFRIFQVPRQPLTAHIVAIALICLLSLIIVAWRLHGSDLRETLISTAVVGGVLWIYFTVVLYRGLRFDHGIVRWRKPTVELPDIVGDLPSADFGGIPADEGCLGMLLAAVLFVVAAVTMAVLISVGIELGLAAGLLIAIPLYALFRYSARLVVVNAKRCRGRMGAASMIGLGYAAAYATVIGVLFFVVNAFFVKRS